MEIPLYIPSLEQRLRAYHELKGSAKSFGSGAPAKPTITLSREFGCEAYPVAEKLVKLCERATGEKWLLVDISLINAVAKEHNIPEEVMLSLGHKPRWLDDVFATFSAKWKTDVEYYQLLCDQVVMLAKQGNTIFVGLAAAVMTRSMPNCFHFRLIAERDFRFRSIARRMQITREEAEALVLEKEKERDEIIRKLLDADENDPLYYHAIFNNGKVGNQEIAETIAELVLNKFKR